MNASAPTLPQQAVPSLPQVFGRYLLIKRLSRGGMGEIFLGKLGEIEGFEKPVIVKKILPNLSAYGSLSYTKTRIKSDIQYGGSTKSEATAGKDFPDTPRWLAGFALQYSDATWLAGVDCFESVAIKGDS